MTEKSTLEALKNRIQELEDLLRQSENRFRLLLKNSSDIQVIIDEKGVERYVSESVEVMTGFSPEEFMGKSGFEFVHPEDIPGLVAAFEELKIGKSDSVSAEYRHIKKDGSWLTFEATGNNLLDDPTIKGVVLNVRDVTKERAAEQALKNSEERYRSIIENIQEGYYEVDLKGSFTFYNEAMRNILGYENHEMPGLNNRDYTDEINAKKLYRTFNKVYQDGVPTKGFDWEIIRKDGGVRTLETSVALARDEAGNPSGFRGIARDVTEEKRLKSRLQRAEKMETVGALAGGVAHDLNNILSGLVSYPELLLLQLSEDSPLKKPISVIKESGDRAVAVVQDLLTLARRAVVVKEPVNLNRLVLDFLESPEYEKIQECSPGVETEAYLTEETELCVTGSPIHLTKTIVNLVANAAEAMPEGGRIILSTAQQYIDRPVEGYDHIQEGDYMTLCVSDNGTGIPSRDLDKIFEPFYTRKKMGRSGTGLGMAVVWGTVKDHNGFIDVESTPGRGTTFKLFFPASREIPKKDALERRLEDYSGKGETVLIVDDVPEQREVAREMLDQLGYQSVAVPSGESAIAYLKKHSVNLVLLDMIMDPGMDGLDTYRRIIEIQPDQKVVIASGFSETVRVREAQRLGAGAYIKKPLLMENLGIAVRDELKQKKTEP